MKLGESDTNPEVQTRTNRISSIRSTLSAFHGGHDLYSGWHKLVKRPSGVLALTTYIDPEMRQIDGIQRLIKESGLPFPISASVAVVEAKKEGRPGKVALLLQNHTAEVKGVIGSEGSRIHFYNSDGVRRTVTGVNTTEVLGDIDRLVRRIKSSISSGF